MAGKLNTLTGRMVLVLLLVHAVLLPALFYGVVTVVEQGEKDAFIDYTRMHARFLADTLELNGELSSEAEMIRQLDSIILAGSAVYAVVLIRDELVTSTLMDPGQEHSFIEDFTFGGHDDDVYYLSIPIYLEASTAIARLGFDETTTIENLRTIKQTILRILFSYLIVSLVVVLLFSTILVRPILRLKRASRAIATGDYERKLRTKSKLFEIRELAKDLEIMRSNLVGVNTQLQEEVVERQAAEAERRTLEDRLRHSQRVESIGTLAGGIAHEFNNALAPIVLYTELAMEDIDGSSPAQPKLRRVMDLAMRAKGLSQQILSFGRPSSEVDRVPVDLAPVVEESFSLVRALVPATIDIKVDIRQNLGLVMCDTTQVQQLVVNLCSNAFRSLSKGGGDIAIGLKRVNVTKAFAKTRPRLSEGTHVVLSVRDNGEGIGPEAIDRVFEPFFTTRTVGEGSGLGLSVVHGIVQKHEGDIIVSSKMGRGSTFSVYFPLVGKQTENGSAA